MKAKTIDNIKKEIYRFNKDTNEYLGVLFFNVFETRPNQYYIYYDENDQLSYNSAFKKFDIYKKIKSHIDAKKLAQSAWQRSTAADQSVFIIAYSSEMYLVICEDAKCRYIMNIDVCDGQDNCLVQEIYTDNIEAAFDACSQFFGKYKEDNDAIEFGIASIDSANSLYTSWYDYKEVAVDIEKNYNDDLPYDRICELIEMDDTPELMLFYGEAGTGKSTLIKHLINKYKTKRFIFMDGSLLGNMQQQKLMNYFMENDHSIFILEDCEKVLVDREHYVNPAMPILLNITDGIMADVLGIKLICTFNTDFNKIDKALKRRGRLSLKYEFRKLDKTKAKVLLNDDTIDQDMTLADIYYYKKENDFSKKNVKKIGF